MVKRENECTENSRERFCREVCAVIREGRTESKQDFNVCLPETHTYRHRSQVHEGQKPVHKQVSRTTGTDRKNRNSYRSCNQYRNPGRQKKQTERQKETMRQKKTPR